MKPIKTITIPTESLVEAWNLVQRFQKSASFRDYVLDRPQLVIPAGIVFLALATAAVAATVFLLARGAFVLPAFVLAPFLLAGTYAVSAYLFFLWLETRALRKALGHGPAGPALPPLPWGYIAVFLALPVFVLVVTWWMLALFLLILAVATPFAFAHFDRRLG